MSDLRSINTYIDETFVENDEVLAEVIASIEAEGMPSISVSASSGKLLTLLIAISGARNVLEIGALGGYSGICLARGFGEDGSLTSLELEARYAELAHSNLALSSCLITSLPAGQWRITRWNLQRTRKL